MLAEEGAKSVVLLSRRGVVGALTAIFPCRQAYDSSRVQPSSVGPNEVMIWRVCGRNCRILTWNSKWKPVMWQASAMCRTIPCWRVWCKMLQVDMTLWWCIPGKHLSFVLSPKEDLFQSKQGIFGFQVILVWVFFLFLTKFSDWSDLGLQLVITRRWPCLWTQSRCPFVVSFTWLLS